MSKQYPGGLITKSPVTPSGPYENSTASGIWTLDQQAYWAKLGQWPTAGNFPKDAQFNYVTMLLHGDGTNGAQNNTFVDSSTNNFTITRNGNTTQGSFSPYGDNWSNFFNGAGNYLTVPDNAAFNLGSSDFTAECWAYFNSSANQYFFGQIQATVSNRSFYFAIIASKLYFEVRSGSTAYSITAASNVVLNQWLHIAAVRNGSTITLYQNGVSIGTVSVSGVTVNDSTNLLGVGCGGGYVAEPMIGYISNARLVVGTAVYTAAFTPPTVPLTAITNTVLLTCQSNRFVDNSTNNFTFTVTGTPSVQRFNPFGASTAYSTSVIGGSGYFDGSGDYLSIASNSTFATTSGYTMTYEAWVYPTRIDTEMAIFSRQRTTSPYTGYVLGIRYGYPAIDSVGTSGTSGALDGSTLVTANQWNYIVWQFDHDGNQSIYLNGTRIANATGRAVDPSFTIALNIGMYNDNSSQSLYGYVSNARFIKQTTAYYSGTTITVPTAPLTAITNTQLLTSYTNGAIFDNAMMNDLETVGNAQISTSVVKYGTGSLAFDGTNNCCLTTQSAMSSSGPFTFECWAYWNDTALSTDMGMLCSQYESGASGRMLFGSQSGDLVLRVDGGTIYLTASVSTGVWYFVAWTFDGTTHRLFLNGTLASSSTSVPALYTGVNTSIGGQPEALLANYCLDGYIDDLRITKGYARYTANFTPPTAEFPNIGPT